MSKLVKLLHKRGLHWYSIPLERSQKEVYFIPGENGASSEEKYKVYIKVKCRYCDRHKNKLEGTFIRTYY